MSPAKTPEDTRMTFGEHLEELRRRLWLSVIGVAVALVVCFIFGRTLIELLKAPIIDALRNSGVENPRLVAINFIDPFLIYVKVALIAALFVGSPWIAYHLWQFVASGLSPRERRDIYLFAPVTVLLFLAGAVFSYTILVRFGIRFLIEFGMKMGIEPMLSVDKNLMFVLVLSLVMGLVFQLPLVMLVLTKIGIIDSRTFVKKRKIFVIVALVLAAVITPTQDAINLALATAPILALYEMGIWISRLAERRRAKNLAG